eukprot:2257965-Prymnesium_polylepis.1
MPAARARVRPAAVRVFARGRRRRGPVARVCARTADLAASARRRAMVAETHEVLALGGREEVVDLVDERRGAERLRTPQLLK